MKDVKGKQVVSTAVRILCQLTPWLLLMEFRFVHVWPVSWKMEGTERTSSNPGVLRKLEPGILTCPCSLSNCSRAALPHHIARGWIRVLVYDIWMKMWATY